MSKLSESEVTDRLSGLPDWVRDESGGGIARVIEFESFADGIEFVNRVAAIADEHDHHPDIDIRYRRVKFGLVSHDIGGLSNRDFRMASLIDGMVSQSGIDSQYG